MVANNIAYPHAGVLSSQLQGFAMASDLVLGTRADLDADACVERRHRVSTRVDAPGTGRAGGQLALADTDARYDRRRVRIRR